MSPRAVGPLHLFTCFPGFEGPFCPAHSPRTIRPASIWSALGICSVIRDGPCSCLSRLGPTKWASGHQAEPCSWTLVFPQNALPLSSNSESSDKRLCTPPEQDIVVSIGQAKPGSSIFQTSWQDVVKPCPSDRSGASFQELPEDGEAWGAGLECGVAFHASAPSSPCCKPCPARAAHLCHMGTATPFTPCLPSQ